MTIQVFILDDHAMVRSGLRALLEREPDLVVSAEAGSAAEARELIQDATIDVAVLDVVLPDGDGIEVCREVRSSRPDIACLMLTAHPSDEAQLAAILAGAAGYIPKKVGEMDLISAIRAVARGDKLMPIELRARAAELADQRIRNSRLMESLSAQERRVFDLIAAGCTNRQIAEQLFLAETTVRNYVSKLLVKLGMRDRTQAAILGTQTRASGLAPGTSDTTPNR